MKKLLITGFEPFGGEDCNPSWDAVSMLPDQIGSYMVVKTCLPVVFGKSSAILKNLAEAIRPDVIICVGQAGGRRAITPEFMAFNIRHSYTSDNDGFCPDHESIIESGDSAYYSTLPIKKMTCAINEAGIPAEISYSAGTFVCNELFYSMLYNFRSSNISIGFIHVPYSKSQNKEPSMDIERIANALQIAIENLD